MTRATARAMPESLLARSGTDANPHTLKPMDCRTEPPRPLSDVISSTLDCGLIRRLDDSRSNSTRDSSRANHLARRASGPPRQAPGFSVFRRLRNARGCPAALQKQPGAHPSPRPRSTGYPGRSGIQSNAPSLFSGKPDVIVARRMSHLWDAVRPQQTWRTETALRGWPRAGW
jgi:hypothetical protein